MRLGFLNVALVVCRDLPLEKSYFQWLLFAPADSQKWREFVKMLARSGEVALLRDLVKLKPKEMKFMATDIEEILEVTSF